MKYKCGNGWCLLTFPDSMNNREKQCSKLFLQRNFNDYFSRVIDLHWDWKILILLYLFILRRTRIKLSSFHTYITEVLSNLLFKCKLNQFWFLNRLTNTLTVYTWKLQFVFILTKDGQFVFTLVRDQDGHFMKK